MKQVYIKLISRELHIQKSKKQKRKKKIKPYVKMNRNYKV